MAAPRRDFKNENVDLPGGDTIRVGTHLAQDGTETLKLRLPGEWSVDQLFRGAQNAKMTVLVVTRR